MTWHKLFSLLVNLAFIKFLTKDPGSLLPFVAAIILAIKTYFDARAQFESTCVSPSMALHTLLKPSRPQSEERLCAICRDDFFRPHKLSCNHIFCRDCALRSLASRDTCPLCFQVPRPFHTTTHAIFELNFEDCLQLARLSFRAAPWWLPQLAFWCIWRRRFPDCADGRLLIMRACFHASLSMALFDYFANKPSSEDDGLELTDLDADVGALVCTLFATSGVTESLSYCAIIISIDWINYIFRVR